MPPKNNKSSSSNKPVVDKTFGLKNKNKSAKVQQFVKQVQAQSGKSGKDKDNKEARKEESNREKALVTAVIPQQKVPFGVDPKTVLCAYFKAGVCEKGAKCKFSHDPTVERKVEKRNLYNDGKEDKTDDTMDKWDEEKLRKVVMSKHGNPRMTTDIVCKHFIQAIETQKFGWFWECPNGDQCQYRHALPPGFVLKSQRRAAEDAAKENVISLEDFLEVERHKLGPNLTPVTAESFAKWKKTRVDKKLVEEESMHRAKEAQNAAGKNNGMSGRDLFTYRPEWFDEVDSDAEDWDISKYRNEKEEEDRIAEELRIANLGLHNGNAHREPGYGVVDSDCQ